VSVHREMSCRYTRWYANNRWTYNYSFSRCFCVYHVFVYFGPVASYYLTINL